MDGRSQEKRKSFSTFLQIASRATAVVWYRAIRREQAANHGSTKTSSSELDKESPILETDVCQETGCFQQSGRDLVWPQGRKWVLRLHGTKKGIALPLAKVSDMWDGASNRGQTNQSRTSQYCTIFTQHISHALFPISPSPSS